MCKQATPTSCYWYLSPRWVFFPPEDTPLLYPRYTTSTDATFAVDVMNPDLSSHPLYCHAHPTECVLRSGEILFVPAGCPHRVHNLTDSLAISSNFVDVSNIADVRRELRAAGLVDEGAWHLLSQLEGGALESDEEQKDLSWHQFKTWPRTIDKPFRIHDHTQAFRVEPRLSPIPSESRITAKPF